MKLPAAAVLVLASAACAQGTFKLTPVPEGAGKGLGYNPQRVTLSSHKPATITKLPEGLVSPRFGVLKFASGESASDGKVAVYHVVVDEPEEGTAKLLIDSNGNGDLTDDGEAKWKDEPRKNKEGEEFH